MRLFISLISVFFVVLPTPAQDRAPSECAGPCGDRLLRLQRDLLRWQIENRTLSVDKELAEGRAAEYERREFARKVNRFAEIWNKLIGEYNKRGSLNVKDARALNKAFRDIQETGWPK